MHEELKKQYEEDCKFYGKKEAGKLYQFCNPNGTEGWQDCNGEPLFISSHEYHRKEPLFVPEYFSGLNWHEAEKLVGKVVEFSQDGAVWTDRGNLLEIFEHERRTCRYRREGYLDYFIYIRTCPETYAHPTINIGGVELPMPEVQSPEKGSLVYIFAPEIPKKYFQILWYEDTINNRRLSDGVIHLAESRAQAWTDWWENTVIKAMKGE